jgi:hypothetical protein
MIKGGRGAWRTTHTDSRCAEVSDIEDARTTMVVNRRRRIPGASVGDSVPLHDESTHYTREDHHGEPKRRNAVRAGNPRSGAAMVLPAMWIPWREYVEGSRERAQHRRGGKVSTGHNTLYTAVRVLAVVENPGGGRAPTRDRGEGGLQLRRKH